MKKKRLICLNINQWDIDCYLEIYDLMMFGRVNEFDRVWNKHLRKKIDMLDRYDLNE